MRPSFFQHLHPPSIPARQARLRYTLGAGGASVFFALALIVSGLLLVFFYVPTPEQAPLSVQEITYIVPFGALVRGIHYWAGQLLVLSVGLHLLRVYLTGGYARPRRFNTLLGLALFVLVLLLDFTGYVLRWDAGVHWALVVGTNLLRSVPLIGEGLYAFVVGGAQVNPATLLRFYAWHLFGLSLPFVFLAFWHLFRLRRDGGIAAPPPALRRDGSRIKRAVLVRREAAAALLLGALLLLLAAFLPAPIAPPILADSAPPADARAPWFFLWVQVLLRWGDPFPVGVVAPLAVLLLLALLPYVSPSPAPAELGAWLPRGGRPVQIILTLLALAWLGLTLWGGLTVP